MKKKKGLLKGLDKSKKDSLNLKGDAELRKAVIFSTLTKLQEQISSGLLEKIENNPPEEVKKNLRLINELLEAEFEAPVPPRDSSSEESS